MNWLGIFVKQPVPGRVKTRLAADIGDDGAAELYAAFTADVVERFRDVADERYLWITPRDECSVTHFMDLAGTHYGVGAQEGESLGDRLVDCTEHAFDTGAERVVIIGSDSPLLPLEYLERAFVMLRDRDVVLGPATDGGYYLVGLSRRLPILFDRIDWSGPRVLADTIARVHEASATLALLPPWSDVDTLEDLHALRGYVAALRAAGEPVDLPRTEPLLADPALDAALHGAADL